MGTPCLVPLGARCLAPWAAAFPLMEVVEAGGAELYVLHILEELDLDPAAAGFAAVIFGHTPILIRLEVEDGELRPELVRLEE